MHCPACGHENKSNLHFCVNCGEKLPEQSGSSGEKKFCPNCGKQNPVEARFCEDCGSAILSPDNFASVPQPVSQPISPPVIQSRSFVWLWALLGLGLVALAAGLMYVYWLPKADSPAQAPVVSSQTSSPAFSCTPKDAFYAEDFEDGQMQDWPEVQQLSPAFKIVPALDDPGNLVLSVQRPQDASEALQAGPRLSVSPFSNAVLVIRFMIEGAMPADEANWFSFNWLYSPYPILVDGKEVYDSRYQLPVGYNYFEMRRLQQPLTNTSVARGSSFPNLGKWYSLEVATFEADTSVWLDGTLLMEYQDPQPLPAGTFGLEAWLDDPDIKLLFDDIMICELKAPYTSAVP